MIGSAFEGIFLVGLVTYFFGVYAPNVQRYKRRKVIRVETNWLDILLDMVAFAAWQAIPLVYIFTAWLDFADYQLWWWAGWVGAVLLALAVWLLWRSYADLGRNWSPKIEILEAQSLITKGVYRNTRHPVHLALWLWGAAQALLLWNWIAGPSLLVVFLPLYLVRVPREERMMLEHFGEEYRSYMDQTNRLLPRFRR
jgi:protein-S-isoprenylcysteine O-methyltransferase Ste14